MTDEEIFAALDRFYEKIPKIKCQGTCWNSCGPIDMSDAEWRRVNSQSTTIQIEPFTSERAQRWARDEPLHCAALSAFGTCKIYDVRPTICRLWGVTESMPCPQGCPIEGRRKRLTDQEGFELLMESMEIGGGDYAGKSKQLREVFTDPSVQAVYSKWIQGDRSVERELIRAIDATNRRLGYGTEARS